MNMERERETHGEWGPFWVVHALQSQMQKTYCIWKMTHSHQSLCAASAPTREIIRPPYLH